MNHMHATLVIIINGFGYTVPHHCNQNYVKVIFCSSKKCCYAFPGQNGRLGIHRTPVIYFSPPKAIKKNIEPKHISSQFQYKQKKVTTLMYPKNQSNEEPPEVNCGNTTHANRDDLQLDAHDQSPNHFLT